MAMRSASAKLFAGDLRAAEEGVGGRYYGVSGRGMSTTLFGDEASRVATRPANLRAATGAAANGGRRFFSSGQGRLPCGGNTTTRGLILPAKLKREGAEVASGDIDKCPHVKIFKLEIESKFEKALSAQKSEYEAKLSVQKGELEVKLDAAVACIRGEFEMKLRDTQNEWKLDFSGLKSFVAQVENAVKSVEAKCAGLAEKHKNFKDTFEVQSVQYSMIKIIGGMMTLAGGVLVTHDKLKEHLIPCLGRSVTGNPLGAQAFGNDWWD